MLRYYNVDLRSVVTGELAPSLALALVEALPLGSATLAHIKDADNWTAFVGATRDFYAMAGIYDAVNLNTAATGNWGKKKPPKFDPFPIPEVAIKLKKELDAKRPKSVADLFGRFNGTLGGARKKD